MGRLRELELQLEVVPPRFLKLCVILLNYSVDLCFNIAKLSFLVLLHSLEVGLGSSQLKVLRLKHLFQLLW